MKKKKRQPKKKQQRKKKIQLRSLHCWNDALFKKFCTSIDGFIEAIVQGATDLAIDSLHITNPEIVPLHSDGRKVLMDLLTKDEMGNFYDVEMQNGKLTEEEMIRFCFYMSRIIVQQSVKGKSFVETIKKVYGIILLNDGIDFDGLIRVDVMNHEGDILPGIREYLIIINMPYINVVASEKGLKGLNQFERIIYALHNDLRSDILELEDWMVRSMKMTKEEMVLGTSKEAEFMFKRELMIWQEEAMKHKMKQLKTELVDLKGENTNLKDQNIDLKGENTDLKGENTNLKDQMQMGIKNIMNTFGISYEKAEALFMK